MTPTITTPIHRVRFLQKVYVDGEWKAELRPHEGGGKKLEIELSGGGFVAAALTKGLGSARTRQRYLFAVANVQEIEFSPETAPADAEKPKAPKKS